MGQTVSDIRARFAAKMNENRRINEQLTAKAPTLNKQPFWDSYFKNVPVAAIPINTKRREVIRAPFGANDGKEAEENITKMFKGAGYEVKEIQFHDKGVLRSPKNDLGSNDYPTYLVITEDGDEYYITNNIVELDGGGVSEIGKKVTNPSSMGLADIEFTKLSSLVSAIKSNLDTKNWSDSTKNFMMGLVNCVANEPKLKFKDMQAFWDAGEISETLDISKYVDSEIEIDERSKRNIINDFGEVLDGVYVIKTVKDLGTSLVFPGSGNEALADLYIEPWAISSKAKKGGGKPSINALVNACKDNEAMGLPLNPSNSKEQELYDMFISFSKIVKGKTLPTVESYIIAANTLIKNGSMKNSGFEFFIKTSGLNPNLTDRNDIIEWLESYAKKDAAKFDKFIIDYRKKCKVRPKSPMTAKSFLEDPIGDGFYYPFAVEVARVLNSNYKEALKTLINKFLVVKQMYFSVNLNSNSLSIRSTSSNTIKGASFMARGSARNFNAGLGYEMK